MYRRRAGKESANVLARQEKHVRHERSELAALKTMLIAQDLDVKALTRDADDEG